MSIAVECLMQFSSWFSINPLHSSLPRIRCNICGLLLERNVTLKKHKSYNKKCKSIVKKLRAVATKADSAGKCRICGAIFISEQRMVRI